MPAVAHGVLSLSGGLSLAGAALQGLDGPGDTQVHQLAGDAAHLDLVGVLDEPQVHSVLGDIHIALDLELRLQAVQEVHAGVVALHAHGEGAAAQKLPHGVHGVHGHGLGGAPLAVAQDLVHRALIDGVVVADAVDQQKGVIPGEDEVGDVADEDGVEVAEVEHVLGAHEDGDIHPFAGHDVLHLPDALLDIAAQLRAGALFV